MSSPTGGGPRVDLYVDGLLEGGQLAAFERELRGSAALRAELESQERIDGELRRMFVYDPTRAGEPIAVSAPDVIGRVDGRASAGSDRKSGSIARFGWYGLAAAVLLAGAAVFNIVMDRRTAIDRTRTPTAVYLATDKPEFVCKDDTEFAAAVKKQLGQPLILAAAPGIEALGWAYGANYNGKVVGDKTMVLITRVDGEKVLVLMDRLRDDRTLDDQPLGEGLHLFRSVVGSIVLYEVTPLPKMRVIENLRVPGGQ